MALVEPGTSGRCPHCQHVVYFAWAQKHGNGSPTTRGTTFFTAQEGIGLHVAACPNCKRVIMSMYQMIPDDEGYLHEIEGSEVLIWPLLGENRTVPPEVPQAIAEMYRKAALIVNLVPEMSAAMSRRCLQAVLTDKGHKQRDLFDQITAAKDELPTDTYGDLDHIRIIGNFGAHPNKATATGEIIDVAAGEADWNLHVLDLLFDHYYVRPAKSQQMRAAAQAKLQAAQTRAQSGTNAP